MLWSCKVDVLETLVRRWKRDDEVAVERKVAAWNEVSVPVMWRRECAGMTFEACECVHKG